ncbi:gas vesicle protein [Hoyosella sp. YIM 151337]|uniref:gas vesicle protein n=1 Tax=Hoyosella sp. YIM 151337 TaxID=2992742 RepID=UPI002235A023|nr:gas vesicle protein [Hoyosella sp. YIM 151337]MCW4351783.1 gas vesicle protein [Hoyosella sp. YIM 151337]
MSDVARYEPATRAEPERRIALVDLLDRVLAGGVVISGDITLSIADVDLVRISLRTLISSVSALEPALRQEDHDAGG